MTDQPYYEMYQLTFAGSQKYMENLRKRNTHKPNWLGVTRFIRNCETDKAEKRRIKIAHIQRRSVQDEARGPSALPLVEEICVTRPSGQVFSEAQAICIAYMTWWWFIYRILLHVEDRYRLCAQYGSVFNLAVLQAQSTITPTAQSSGLRPADRFGLLTNRRRIIVSR